MRKCIREVIQRWAVEGIKTNDFDMEVLEDAMVELWNQTLESLIKNPETQP